MKILAIDSSSKVASVAILEDDKILGEFFVNVGLTHSQTLVPMVKNLLEVTNVDLSLIDLFAVTKGPGSFTGVRIGLSVLKGLDFYFKKSCVGVSTLLALAYNQLGKEAIVCSLMDARCNQVYNAVFKVNNNSVERLTQDRAISIEELFLELKEEYKGKEIILLGDGAKLCYNSWEANFKENINLFLSLKLAQENNLYQRASSVAFAAKDLLKTGKSESVEELTPFYLREPGAKRKLLSQKEDVL